MSKYSEFLKEFVNSRTAKLMQGFAGTIEQYDEKIMRATVQPLLKHQTSESEIDYPLLTDVPVMIQTTGNHIIRPEYKKGDLVLCLALSQDMQKQIKGEAEIVDNNYYNPSNAIVIGGITPNNFALPANVASLPGLLIANDSGFIQLKSDGQININNNFTVDA